MKKIIKKLTLLLIVVLFGVTLISCGKNDEEKTVEEKPVEIVYDIHTDVQNNYLSDTYDSIWRYGKGTEELSKPLPITIKWDLPQTNFYEFHLSESSDFTVQYILETNTNEISVYNLKINTPYYWYLSYEENGVVTQTNVETFTITSKTPRNLSIDGVTNARDLGGYVGKDGKTTKQGMIIRCSKFNDDESTELLITEDGIREMLEVLNVKTELDIRKSDENGGITESPLGPTVTYYSIPMQSSGNKILLNKE